MSRVRAPFALSAPLPRIGLSLVALCVALGAAAGAGAETKGPGGAPRQDVRVIEAPDDTGPIRGSASDAAGRDAQRDVLAEDIAPLAEAMALAPVRVPRGAATVRGMGVPVVVELFTAQGCSTCPAADDLIAALADQPDVLTLSWHVDYWDYLGWADSFADPRHTTRQEAYAAAAGERGVYTPQIVVDGQDTLIGVGRAGLLSLIDDHASRPPAVMVTASAGRGGFVIDLTPRAAIPGGVELLLIRYLPRREVRIDAGENRGREMVYRNIVIGVEKLADWPARTPLRLNVSTSVQPDAESGGAYPSDTRHAVIAQQPVRGGRPGPILAAVRLD